MMKVVIFMALSFCVLNASARHVYESQLSADIVEDQRKYSGDMILEMLQFTKFNSEKCNVEVYGNNDTFVIRTHDGYSFRYSNVAYEEEEIRLSSHYQCILTHDRSKLDCARRLPAMEMYDSTSRYIDLTLYLNKSGVITSFKGVGTEKKMLFGYQPDFLSKIFTEFECEVDYPSRTPSSKASKKVSENLKKVRK